jgi:hypothetical protein
MLLKLFLKLLFLLEEFSGQVGVRLLSLQNGLKLVGLILSLTFLGQSEKVLPALAYVLS